MKRQLNVFLIALLFAALLLPSQAALAAAGDTYTDGVFNFKELSDGTLSVTGYMGPDDVVIPASYNPGSGDKQVTRIESDVFRNNLAIESVVIPDSIITIGTDSFSGCTNLNSVTISANSKLETLEQGAFYATGLTSINFPKSVKTIGYSAFSGCASLETITFSDDGNLQTIGTGAFYHTAVHTISIPKSVTLIADDAFSGCANLTSVTFAEDINLLKLNTGAFYATGLTSVTVPASVKSIGTDTFSSCANLTSVIFEEGSILQTIQTGAFWSTGITSITLPRHLQSIGTQAFENTHLTKVIIESDSVTFGSYVFANAPMTDGIYGFAPSTAQTYASNNSIQFNQLYKVLYDSQGGSDIDFDYTSVLGDSVNQPDDPFYSDNIFKGWFTEPECVNEVNFPYTVAGNVALYAKWIPVLKLASSDSDGIIYKGGRITLTPNIQGGIWNVDAAFLSQNGYTFTALKAGTTQVEYTAEGQSVVYNITINQTQLPQTGQNFTIVFVLAGVAIITAGIAWYFLKRKKA